jgi:hypothetical protein
MEYSYCPNCQKMTGHKRALGWGTFFGGVFTAGLSLGAIPLYPKRCIVCGRKSSGEEISFTGIFSEFPQHSSPSGFDTPEEPEPSLTKKKCPFCAELIQLEAIKCRFCGEKFDPTEVARQVSAVTDRVLCSDGNCIGVIGPNGRCKVCGK